MVGPKVPCQSLKTKGLVRFGTWNIGSMTGKGDELACRAKKRGLKMCFLQETKWKGEKVKWFGDYKFYYKGQDREKKEGRKEASETVQQRKEGKVEKKKKKTAEAGVGVMIVKELAERVIEDVF